MLKVCASCKYATYVFDDEAIEFDCIVPSCSNQKSFHFNDYCPADFCCEFWEKKDKNSHVLAT